MVFLLILGLWLAWSPPCLAQRTLPADKPLHVKVAVGQPTSVAFPEVIESVQWMKMGDNADDQPYSVTSRGPYLFLMLRHPGYSGHLFVLGMSGEQYPVFFKEGTPADITVHVTRGQPAKGPRTKATALGVPSVLRALYTQQALPGQQELDLTPPVIPDTRVTLVTSKAISIAGLIGLTLQLRNTTEQPLALDVRVDTSEPVGNDTVVVARWVWAPRLTLKALAAPQEVLMPGTETPLYVVLERR